MTFAPTRRTALRTAAWTVPAVTVATAAPAFASSARYDLSGSGLNAAATKFTRTGATVLFEPFHVTNTGDADVTNCIHVFKASTNITRVEIVTPFATVDAGQGMGASFTNAPTLPATEVSLRFLQFGTIEPGEVMSTIPQFRLTFADANPVTMEVNFLNGDPAVNGTPGSTGSFTV